MHPFGSANELMKINDNFAQYFFLFFTGRIMVYTYRRPFDRRAFTIRTITHTFTNFHEKKYRRINFNSRSMLVKFPFHVLDSLGHFKSFAHLFQIFARNQQHF